MIRCRVTHLGIHSTHLEATTLWRLSMLGSPGKCVEQRVEALKHTGTLGFHVKESQTLDTQTIDDVIRGLLMVKILLLLGFVAAASVVHHKLKSQHIY